MADQDWLSTQGQARAAKERALFHKRLSRARVYAAYKNLATNASWDIFLTDLVEGVLLRPCLGDVDRGKQHLAIEILTHSAMALQEQQVPYDPASGHVLGGLA